MLPPVFLLVLSLPLLNCYWSPSPTNTWMWEIGDALDRTSFTKTTDMYDIDPDNEATDVAFLLQQGVDVICYVNVGSIENGNQRPDSSKFPASVIGAAYPGWPERFLDTRSSTVRSLMQARFQAAASLGCQAIEPDNIDTYTQSTGFPLTIDTAYDYIKWMASTIHSLNMSLALKNGDDLLAAHPDIVDLTDFAIVENCVALKNCANYESFHAKGKAMLGCDYVSGSGSCNPTVGSDAASLQSTCGTYTLQWYSGIVRDCNLSPKEFAHVCSRPAVDPLVNVPNVASKSATIIASKPTNSNQNGQIHPTNVVKSSPVHQPQPTRSAKRFKKFKKFSAKFNPTF